MQTWESELAQARDPDSDFVLEGVREGFRLTTEGSSITPAEVDNYGSTTDPASIGMVHEQIATKVANGRYIKVDTKPTIVSALGAIPKGPGKVRLIHDCSRPEGLSLNSYAEIDRVQFQTVREATSFLKPGYYMAKVDLESAYRSVRVHPDDYESTGLKWRFPGESQPQYMFDTRLPFGAKRAPGIFHRITQSVKHMMERRGFTSLEVYLDDWLIVAPTKEECQESMRVLLQLLRSLGFSVSYKKVEPPTTILVFLGIEIDSVEMKLTLPEGKVIELLDDFQLSGMPLSGNCRFSQASLTGLHSVFVEGGVFSDASLILVASSDMRDTVLNWTNRFLRISSGGRTFLKPFMVPPLAHPLAGRRLPWKPIAHRAVFQEDWLFVDWAAEDPTLAAMHINHKETAAVVLAARRWAPQWEGKKVIVYIDNQAAKQIINKGTTADPGMMVLVRELFWWSVSYDFVVEAVYLQGAANLFADTVSRLHSNNWLLQWALLSQVALNHWQVDQFALDLHLHMPPSSLLVLLPQVTSLGTWRNSSTCVSDSSGHKH